MTDEKKNLSKEERKEQARDELERKEKSLLDEYVRKRKPFVDEFERKVKQLWAEYERERKPLVDEFERICREIDEEDEDDYYRSKNANNRRGTSTSALSRRLKRRTTMTDVECSKCWHVFNTGRYNVCPFCGGQPR